MGKGNYTHIFLIICTLGYYNVQSQPLAFPGAEGFGKYTTGGRGGDVYEVTNLNDAGPGSLRGGIEMEGPRTIVFRVSGTIHLLSELRIRNGHLTIAGHTAPGDGIAVKGYGVVVDADNVIIRYMRFRPGDISGGEPDAIWGRNHRDIIIDHCSMSWAVDEVCSFYDNENFTMQWCIFSESLYESQHEKGRHGYGGIWGGQGATFHHNILAHHSSRNPRFNGSRYSGDPDREIVDYRNNVIFNWGNNSAYGGEAGNHNMVANYYKAGPATAGDKRFRILDASIMDPTDPKPGKWFVEDNYVEGYPEITSDNWNGGVQGITSEQIPEAKVDVPFPVDDINTETAEEAYLSVLLNSGATLPRRDAVDTRIISEIESGTVNFGGAYGAMKGIIDSQEQVGGWPALFSAPAPQDSDHDGIPDQWEIDNSLDPEDPTDGKAITESGYSNLELYLTELENTPPANFLKHPSQVAVAEVSSTSVALSWKNNEIDESLEIILEKSADNESFSVVEVLPANTSEYTDEGLEPATFYFYRLKVSKEEESSAYSPVVQVITKPIPQSPDPEGLVAYFPLDAAAGSKAEDKSAFENGGTLQQITSPSWVEGRVNNALQFQEGSAASHLMVPHAPQIHFEDQSFSVAFWVKAFAQSGQAYVFHKGTFAGVGKWFGLEFKEDFIRFAVDDNLVKSEVATSSEEFLSGEWVHVVVVRDREDKALKMYCNGELKESAADNTNAGIGQDLPLIIGNSDDLDVPFVGTLDEIRIFNYSLDVSEVLALSIGLPFKANSPTPEDGSEGVKPGEIELSWKGDASAGYNVYWGTSAEDLVLEAEGLTEESYAISETWESTTYFWRVDALGENNLLVEGDIWTFATGTITKIDDLPDFESFVCYPNPFSERLILEFDLKKGGAAELTLYDVNQRRIRRIMNDTLDKGSHQIQLEVNSKQLKGLPEGMYILELKTIDRKEQKKIMLLRK